MANGLGFGAGSLWGVSTNSNPTPARFGVLQKASVDFKAAVKPLFGFEQLPVGVARGTMSVSGTAELAQFTPRVYNDLFFGAMSTATTGTLICVDNEAGTVPGVSTYTITVAGGTNTVRDLGVIYQATGLPLTRAASASAIGIYSVSVATGVYTFNSADANAKVFISYEYSASGSGETLSIANQPMGTVTPFVTVLSLLNPNTTKKLTVTLNQCISESIGFATSLEDWTKQNFTFAAYTDASDTLGTIAFAEIM